MTYCLWPEERVAEFAKLTAEGLSASQIAMRLGITRNAVCGKWNRDGRPNVVAPRPRVAPKPKPKPKPKPIAVLVPNEGPVSLDIDIIALTSTTCKWPVNDDNPYRFCGVGKPAEGGPYCPYHARVASRGRNPAA